MIDTNMFWWKHDGTAGQPSYPLTTLGTTTTTHSSSLLFGARAVAIYKIIVTAGVVGDTFAIRTTDSAGSATALTGLSALPCDVTGLEYNFPGGLRIESSSANVSILSVDASVLTIFYKKLS